MRLTVLGGSAAGPNSGQGCAGFLVQHGHDRIVLDLGPGTFPELRRHADFRTLDAAVISHLHLDHLLDLFTLRYALAYNPVRPSRRLPLALPPGGLRFLERAAEVFAGPEAASRFYEDVYEPFEFDPSAVLHVGGLHISFHPTVHYVPCWAIRVDGPGDVGAISYTADTGPAANLAPFAAGSAVLVAEGGAVDHSAESNQARGHLFPEEAGQLASKSGVRTLVLTHVWEEAGVDDARRRAAETFAGRVESARPGLTIEW